MKRSMLVPAVLTLAALVLMSPSKAEAYEVECTGPLSGTWDNVVVPPGQTCLITDATILGNVKALEDSRLLIMHSTVHGNVDTVKADIVQILFTVVREQISIKEGGPAAAPAPQFSVCGFGTEFSPCEVIIAAVTVEVGGIQIEKTVGSMVLQSNIVAGNVKVEENSIAELLFLGQSNVGQNLQLFKNVGSGLKWVQGNEVGQSLQCFENEPPFLAQFNTASSSEGQCAP